MRRLLWLYMRSKKNEWVVVGVYDDRCRAASQVDLKMLQSLEESQCFLFDGGILYLVFIELLGEVTNGVTNFRRILL